MAEYKSIYTGEQIDTAIGKANTALQTELEPAFNASASKNITSQDITNWNNKSDFSGNYNDLTNKPTIPSDTNDLTNGAGFITSTDYATTSNGGVIKLSNVYFTSTTENGALRTGSVTYQQYLDANNGSFVGKGTLENVITGKGLQTQYSTMPTASEDLLGKIVQYVGTTNSTYINGYFYKCVSDGQVTPTYSWEKEPTITMNVTYSDNTTATFELKGREIV